MKALHEQLKGIEAELHAEKTVDKDLQKEDRIAQMMQHMQVRETEDAPEGDEVVTDLLTRCFLWHELIEQK